MSGAGLGGNPKRQPDLYWKSLQQIKTASICIRLYRNRLNRYVKGLEILRAAASSAAIGGWVIWRDYPFVWSSIIVAAQIADALKGVFPFAKMHRAASDLTIAMETICIDAEDEWESIYMGNLSEEAISKRRTKLRKLQLDAERKHFPDGFEPSKALIKLATEEAEIYFRLTYTEENANGSPTNPSDTAEANPARLSYAPGEEYIPDVSGERANAERDG